MQYNCKNCQMLFVFEQSASKAQCTFCGTQQKVPEHPWTPGVVIGFRYKIVAEIGKGGQGVICLARDLLEDKNYALKILFTENFNEELANSFLQEAQAARNFIHPNIVKTYGGNSDNGVFYIVQEWICGIDLIRYEKCIGSINCEQACYILLKICEALEFIWENYSIIHRDIKPSNILIDSTGEVFLTDFGIMVPSNQVDDSDDLHCTPDYVSPEAATGACSLDIRSDIYSLGASFYRLLSGKPPFPGRTADEVISKRLNEYPTPLSRMNKKVPVLFSKMIRKMMSRKKEGRFQSIEELKKAIENCTEKFPGKLRLQDYV